MAFVYCTFLKKVYTLKTVLNFRTEICTVFKTFKMNHSLSVHTCPFLFENRDFFTLVWPPIHTYPEKTVTGNASFKNTLRSLFCFVCSSFENDDVTIYSCMIIPRGLNRPHGKRWRFTHNS